MMKQFLQEEEGQTLVEYGLLISLIALVVIAVLTLLGGRIRAVFGTASNSINTPPYLGLNKKAPALKIRAGAFLCLLTANYL